ncbi:hypothetical protein DFA_04402 [Cavenderia fasciculata]|uniref:Uncharacterized protein n=1 Tax=Cavenderia fasciculata TaxID=261658 RepID=F4PPH1_CACFS|nr:uncharacterized protein DFA_04402 [Cavenderia fasciculata]EGG22284.1 hypothetical protein DFA_04402 [Cavenderia fasciculata]|eukprot:XP_004360135.1 hypothetical protein DFA_04402 [Cavenderia fasciculata]
MKFLLLTFIIISIYGCVVQCDDVGESFTKFNIGSQNFKKQSMFSIEFDIDERTIISSVNGRSKHSEMNATHLEQIMEVINSFRNGFHGENGQHFCESSDPESTSTFTIPAQANYPEEFSISWDEPRCQNIPNFITVMDQYKKN